MNVLPNILKREEKLPFCDHETEEINRVFTPGSKSEGPPSLPDTYGNTDERMTVRRMAKELNFLSFGRVPPKEVFCQVDEVIYEHMERVCLGHEMEYFCEAAGLSENVMLAKRQDKLTKMIDHVT